jgi:hypothetical protein
MSHASRLAWSCLFASVLALTVALAARAQAVDPVRAEAAERFDRALRLVNSGDLQGGLAEFQRAYSLVPSTVALYNVGLVYAALNRPVEAARALTAALARSESLTPENVARAQEVLREQQEKIGQVAVALNMPSLQNAVVEVDNVETAKWPLDRPLDVASGAHVIGVIAPGFAPARREVLVAGRERVDVQFDLVAIEGLLAHIALHGLVPAADVVVDGQRVGKTPLESSVTVTPGAHDVEVRRAGYAAATRSIMLGDGASSDITLDPVVDKGALAHEGGWLDVAASETQCVVSVDGTEIGLLVGAFQVPAGVHRLHVERGGFIATERDVDVPQGGTQRVSVVFEPTPDTRATYVSAAVSRRTWSWATIGTGLAIAAGGAALAIVEQNALKGARSDLAAVNAEWAYKGHGDCDPATQVPKAMQATCDTRLNDATARVDNLETMRTVGLVAAGAGGAILLTGAVLLLTGDNPHRYDEKAPEPLFVGWRLAPQAGLRGFSLAASRSF